MRINRIGQFCLLALCVALPSAASAQESVRYGSARFFPALDELTDEDRSYVLVPGEHNEDTDLTLGWKCEEDGMVLMVITGYMGGDSNNRVVVRYRFDSEEPSPEERWRLYAGDRRAHAPAGRMAELTRRAREAERVVIRVTDPLDGEVKTNTFPLNGVSRALDRLTCEMPEASPKA